MEDGTISRTPTYVQRHGHARAKKKFSGACTERCVALVFILILACIAAPVTAAALNATGAPGVTGQAGPQIIRMGVYVNDFSNYDAREGTFDASFYVRMSSDRPVNITDFEMLNGKAETIGILVDTPNEKYFRVFGKLDTEPDFHRYPFDRHNLPIVVEPRTRDLDELVIVIDKNSTGIDPMANLPGWTHGTGHHEVRNYTYQGDTNTYSRAVFSFDITRDSLSTFLKFFLPVMLIIIVSLASLLMKVTSRLGLNASMFLAAVLIHWRIADAMPMVAYATFLDYFMIITYAVLVMVLLSGILILMYNERKQAEMVDRINSRALRIIPAVAVILYLVLFLTLLF